MFDATVLIAVLILGIFAVDAVARWRRDSAWKRRWRQPPGDTR